MNANHHARPTGAISHREITSTANHADATPWTQLRAAAEQHFGVRRFRPGQRQVIDAIFHGRNVLALMPTGSGKSLCYQLPALFLPKTVVVVSPLLALMQDQQEKAEEADINVQKVDSTLTTSEAAIAEAAIKSGTPQLLYVTPERLENQAFLSNLAAGGVSLLAIDEAHCISQWGHDFRPAYLGLREARQRLGDPPVVALTATATDAVINDILQQLDARDAVIVNTGTERPSLQLAVHRTANAEAKQRLLSELISSEQGSGIVYTASIRTNTEVYDELQSVGLSVACYHGKMRTREREQAQADFMHGQIKVMVATKAFGLGVDKQDIRFVFHYEFPDSLESYYQEAGRAGRDGHPSRAALLYRMEDRRIQSFFLAGRYPRLPEIQLVYDTLKQTTSIAGISERIGTAKRRIQVILHLLKEANLIRRTSRGYAQSAANASQQDIEALLHTYEERTTSDKSRLDEMVHYAESPKCRRQLLRAYFGEDEGSPCCNCDNCACDQAAVVIQDQRPDIKQLLVR